jgi:predicted thioredoxin/glutaredoxin
MTPELPDGSLCQGLLGLSAAPDGKPKLAQREEPEAAIRVEIFVAEHCLSCEYAYSVAGTIEENFPGVDLRIINLSQTTELIPDAVFATPTYLLNGRLWSLGNPSPEDVQARLSSESRQVGRR